MKLVVKKNGKRKDSSNLEYITMGLREVVEGTISSLSQSRSDKLIEEIKNLKGVNSGYIRPKYGNYAETTNTINSLIIFNKRNTVAVKIQAKEMPLSITLEEVIPSKQILNIEDVISVKRKTIIQISSKKYPNFKHSADDIKLKKEMEDMVMMTLKDLASPSNDKTFTKVQREIEAESNNLMKSLGKRAIKGDPMRHISRKNTRMIKSYGTIDNTYEPSFMKEVKRVQEKFQKSTN
ncbi:25556_t:CDS:2 [Gigaspora margarita]|uniref:25556_t:CDS:1 n=1 Tax=Gigaspora margarita TaxID=4874 RepID=A0ABN7VKH4_GIGMA|nr:25556_t:CDS:2 [Gigaspora margarita]